MHTIFQWGGDELTGKWMQGFVIPIRFRMFQSETYVRENEILEKKKNIQMYVFKTKNSKISKID